MGRVVWIHGCVKVWMDWGNEGLTRGGDGMGRGGREKVGNTAFWGGWRGGGGIFLLDIPVGRFALFRVYVYRYVCIFSRGPGKFHPLWGGGGRNNTPYQKMPHNKGAQSRAVAMHACMCMPAYSLNSPNSLFSPFLLPLSLHFPPLPNCQSLSPILPFPSHPRPCPNLKAQISNSSSSQCRTTTSPSSL